jgi:putative ABC transport system permease protein
VLQLILSSVRSRLVSFVGAFLAGSLAVTIVAGVGLLIDARSRAHVLVPTDLRAVSLIVQPGMQTDQGGTSRTEPHTTAPGQAANPPPVQLRERPRLPASLLDQVRAEPGVRSAAGYLAFLAQALDRRGQPLAAPPDVPDQGHPWSSAALTPFTPSTGRAPSGAGEVAVDAALAERGGFHVGDRMQVLSSAGIQPFTVVGIVTPEGGDGISTEAALFFADQVSPALSGTDDRLDAIGVYAEPGTDVRALQSRLAHDLSIPGLDVRTPAEVSQQESPASVTSLNAAISFLAVLGVFVVFIAVVVSANTYSISVLQRTREIALLRAVGATTNQVRLLIVGESLVVSAVAAAVGCVAGVQLAAVFAPILVQGGLAPVGFRAPVSPLPLLLAIAISAGAGLLAVVTAVWRVARIRPVEALQEAAVERPAIGPLRVLVGLAITSFGALQMFFVARAGGGLLAGNNVIAAAFVLSAGVALLGPVLVRPLAWLLGTPVAMLTRATGLLARSNTVANARRTASSTVPLMLMIVLSCVALFESATMDHVAVERAARWLNADFVLRSAGGGLPASLAGSVAGLPGVAAAPGVITTTLFLENRSFNPVAGEQTLGVDPARVGGALDFGVLSGSLNDLHGDAFALSATVAHDHGWRAGDTVQVWMDDGRPAALKLVAVFSDGIPVHAVLPRALAALHGRDAVDGAVYVEVGRGADSGAVAAELDRTAARYGAVQVVSRAAYLTDLATPPLDSKISEYLLIAVVVAFTGVAIVNTLVMATAERIREFALLRLAGTTRAQVVRMVSWETAIVVVVGVLLGTLITAAALVAFSQAFVGRLDVAVNPGTYGVMVSLCVVLGFGASLLPVWLALRAQPVQAMGTRE